MFNVIDILKAPMRDFKQLMNNQMYNQLIQRKMKIIIEAAKLGKIKGTKTFIIERMGIDSDDMQQAQQFVDSLDIEWYEIKRNGDFSQLSKDRVASVLCTLERGEAVMLRDFVITDYCGYAKINGDGNYFLEIKKGGFMSFWEGKEIPTYYILDRNLNVIRYDERKCSSFYAYDFENMHWSKYNDEKEEIVTLTHEEQTKIVEVLLDINNHYHNSKIAWIKSGDDIVVFDIWMMFGQGVLE